MTTNMICYLAFNIFTNWITVGEFEGKNVEVGRVITEESLRIELSDGSRRLVVNTKTNTLETFHRFVEKTNKGYISITWTNSIEILPSSKTVKIDHTYMNPIPRMR